MDLRKHLSWKQKTVFLEILQHKKFTFHGDCALLVSCSFNWKTFLSSCWSFLRSSADEKKKKKRMLSQLSVRGERDVAKREKLPWGDVLWCGVKVLKMTKFSYKISYTLRSQTYSIK